MLYFLPMRGRPKTVERGGGEILDDVQLDAIVKLEINLQAIS